jgi:hypothetical protein
VTGAGERSARPGDLYLCRLCVNRHWPVLPARGWNIGPAGGNSPARAEDCILVGD